jgi:hypothetical protein
VTSSGHGHLGTGQAYSSSGSALTGFTYFNCCNTAGGCYDTGTDGCGFGNQESYLSNEGSPYGIAYGHSWFGYINGAWSSNTAWGTQGASISDTITTWYRKPCQYGYGWNGSSCIPTRASCKDHLPANSGNGLYYTTNYGTIAAESHYCLMDTSFDGGGWTLLLTMTNAASNFGGSVNPFVTPGSVGSPSRSAAYTRNRANTFTPQVNDEFMLVRETTQAWVKFKISNWQAGGSWSAVTSSGHGHFGTGQAYGSNGAALSGFTYFNCCNRAGGCYDTGSDGCGFGTLESWFDNSGYGTAYGHAWFGSSPNGAWGTQGASISDTFTTWFRRAS